MENNSRYVVNSQNTLYRLPNSSCSEGDTVTLNNTLVQRYYLVNGSWTSADLYTTSSYSNTSYICHVWNNEKLTYDINYLLLPATIFVCLFFAIIYRWFIRMRG